MYINKKKVINKTLLDKVLIKTRIGAKLFRVKKIISPSMLLTLAAFGTRNDSRERGELYSKLEHALGE